MADYDYQAELKKKQLEEAAASETDSSTDEPPDDSTETETDSKPVEEEARAEKKKIGGPGYQIQFIRQEAPGEEPAPKEEPPKPAVAPAPTPEDPGAEGGPESFTDTATDQQVVAPPVPSTTKVIAPPPIEGDPGQVHDIEATEDVTHHYQEIPTPPPIKPPDTGVVAAAPEPTPTPEQKPTPNVQVGTLEGGKFVPQEQQPGQKPEPADVPAVKIPSTIMGLNRIDKEAADAKPDATAVDTTASDNRVQNGVSLKGTDSRITDILTNAARILPPGFTIRPTSGVRSAGQGQHTKGNAQDWQIFDPKGNPISNRGDDHTGLYTRLARAAYGYQEKYYPGLTGQFQWGGQFGTSTANNPNEPDLMHFDIGGRRGRIERYSRESIGAVLPPGKGETSGIVSTDQGNIPLKGYITTKATQFGHFDPDDAGVGAPRLGQLDTNDPRLIGLAVPEEQLRRQFGNHPEAWRKARADVVLADGTHVMVPIVDIGPGDEPLSRGVGVDFTYGMSKLVGHQDEKSTYKVKLIGDAGPDVTKDPRAFIREQSQLAKNGPQAMQTPKSSLYGGANFEVLNDGSRMSPAERVSQETAQMYQNQPVYEQWHKLDSINVEQGGNRAKTLEILSQPIEGVNDNLRKDYLDDYKKDLVDFMRVHTNNPNLTEEDAIKQATAAPDVGSFTAEVVNRFLPNIDMAVKNFIGSFDSANENRLQQYAKLIEPDATPAQLKAFKDHLLTVPKEQLADVLYTYNEEAKKRMGLGPNDNVPMDMVGVTDSVRRLQSPQYQQDRQDLINAKAKIGAQLANSPNFEGTAAGKWAGFLAQSPAMLMQIMSGPIGERSMISDIFSSTQDRIKAEHPDWDDDKVREMASASTLAQYAPAAIGLRAAGGKISKWFKGVEENPNMVARIGMSGALHGTIGALAGGTQSALGDIAEGKDVDVQKAEEQAMFGGVQGFAGGMIGGIHQKGNIDHIPMDERLPSDNDRIPKPDDQIPPPTEPVRPTEPTEPVAPDEGDRGTKPTEPVPGDAEEQLNRQNEELIKPPVEGQPIPADITEDDRRAREAELGRGPGEVGKGGEDARGDVGEKPSGDGHPAPGRGEDVQGQLGRMPGHLESKLSPDERVALQPLVDQVAAHPQGTAPAKAAYQKLFEAIYKKFEPLFKAAGSTRKDNPRDFDDGVAAAAFGGQGDLSHWLNHKNLERQMRRNMDRGNDPAQYIHTVLHEELTHHAEQLASRDEWNRVKATTGEDFVQHKFRRSLKVIGNFIAARDQARAKGNHELADEMNRALHESVQMYRIGMGPQEAEGHFQDIYGKAKTGDYTAKNDLSNIASELVRQMVQLRHGDVTEHFFHQAMGAAIQWFQRAISGLKSLYAKLGPGQVLAKTELAKLIRATERKLDTLVRQAGRAAKPAGPATAGERFGPRTAGEHGYDYWQGKIDDELDRLKAKGVDIYKLHDSTLKIPEADKEFWPGWTKMPPHLEELYKKRDATGSEELKSSVDEIKEKLGKHLTQGETKQVLDYYALHPDKTDVADQYRAAQHTQNIVSGDPRRQYESLAVRLAAHRGEMFDELKDIHPDTLRTAAHVVKAMREHFGLTEPAARGELGEGIGPRPAGSKAADLAQEVRKTQAEHSLAGNRGITETVTKYTAKERWWKHPLTKFSTVFKGGESAMLDQDETRGLARLIRRRPSLEQKIGSNIKIHDFYDAWDSVKGKTDKARVTQEIGDYMKAREKGQPLPAISADTQKLVKAWDDLAHLTADQMQRLNVHVKDSQGNVRPFKRLGYGKYFPHTFSADFKDMMDHRDGARKADFDARVAREVAAGKVKDRNEFIDRYANSNTKDLHSNEPFSNQERAREGGFNIDDMDVSPDGMMRYANRSTRRLAQIEAYGQKLSAKGKDAFDHTIKRVQDSPNLTPRQKEMITTRIMQEQNAEYSNRHKDNHSDLVGHISQVASGAFLGNPITSMANLIGGGAHNLAVGGLGSFGRTLRQLPDLAKAFTGKSSLVKEAYERGILRENLRNLMRNYEQTGDQNWMTHKIQGFNQGMLKWGGQHVTENINRAFAMEQGKEFLKEFYRGYGQDNAKMRWIYKHLEQLGISKSEQVDLYKERGTGTVTDEMLRQWVMETHGNYGPSQTAAHIFDSPAGRMLGQFQKWGVNAGRVATRQFVAPMTRAGAQWAMSGFKNKSAGADFAYHLGRNLFLLGTAMGAGSLQQIGRDWMMRRQSNDPTYDDILKRFAKGDNRVAIGESIHKMWDTVILSGMAGQFGNYAELVRQLDPTQNNPGRIKDPMHPPALGLLQPWLQFGQTAMAEGGIRTKTAITLLGQLLSPIRTMTPMVQEAGSALGIPGLKQGAASLTAQNQINFLRSQIQQYASEHPEIKKAANIPFSPDAFSPVRDGFHQALIRGDSIEANRVINHYVGSLPPAQQAGALKSIKASIQQSAPIKVGGSVALPEATAFLQWAKDNLPEAEGRQLFASARTYALAAMQTSIFDGGGAKTMRYLSKLDYDKFGGPVAKKAQSAAAESTLRHFYQKSQTAQQLPRLRLSQQ